MTWQRGGREFADPYVVVLRILRDAVAASSDPDVTGTVVVRTMPSSRPARVVQIRRDGGRTVVAGFVDAPVMTYRVWHSTPRQAQRLAQFVRSALLDAPLTVDDVTVIRADDVMGPVDVVDPSDENTTTYFGRAELWLRP